MVTLTGCGGSTPTQDSLTAPASDTERSGDPTTESNDAATTEPTAVSTDDTTDGLFGFAGCGIEVPEADHDGIGSIRTVNLVGTGVALEVTFELTQPPPVNAIEEVGIELTTDSGSGMRLAAAFLPGRDPFVYVIGDDEENRTDLTGPPVVTGSSVTVTVPAERLQPVGTTWTWTAYNQSKNTRENCPPDPSEGADPPTLPFPAMASDDGTGAAGS